MADATVNRYFHEDLHISSFEHDGKAFTFLLNSRIDHIQGFLERGEFYERDELELLCRHAQGRKRLLDVGANIGNHSIFLAHQLDLQRVVPIEPQPAILHILRANLGLNWHPSFDLSCLGLALADKAGWARLGPFHEDNIGGTSIQPLAETRGSGTDETADLVRLYAGDDLFQPGDFDLIKLDVEGCELEVMRGLRRIISAFEGVMFVEIFDQNIEPFEALIKELGLLKVDEYRRYRKCTNWILIPDR